MMPELAPRHIEHSAVRHGRPIRITWKKDKLWIRINELSDQPRTGHPVHLDVLSCYPTHFGPYFAFLLRAGLSTASSSTRASTRVRIAELAAE